MAFVPLDPRQEADFDLGMKYFFEAGGAQHVFPMHMWGDYSVVPLFKSTPHLPGVRQTCHGRLPARPEF